MKSAVEQTKLLDALKHENGMVLLWGFPCLISPVIGVLVHNRIAEQLNGPESLRKMNYFAEKFQANMGVRITGEKFGFAKTYQNKKDLLMFSSSQSELLGYGKQEWVKTDFDNGFFILKMDSSYAKVYKETMGLSKSPVCHWNAGAWSGVLDYILGKPTACIENSCIAQGKPSCEFIIKPVDKWDKKDPLVKANSYVFDKVQLELGKVRM